MDVTIYDDEDGNMKKHTIEGFIKAMEMTLRQIKRHTHYITSERDISHIYNELYRIARDLNGIETFAKISREQR